MNLTEEQMRKCLDDKGSKCPGCGSLLIAAETCIEAEDDGSAIEPVECLECGTEWIEHYSLTGISQCGIRVDLKNNKQFEVQTNTLCGGWVNTWMDDDGKPIRFNTRAEAESELKEHVKDIADAVAEGHVEDESDEYRIVEVAERESDVSSQ